MEWQLPDLKNYAIAVAVNNRQVEICSVQTDMLRNHKFLIDDYVQAVENQYFALLEYCQELEQELKERE